VSADPACTANVAVVLRPVGAHHRKAEPRRVRLIMSGLPTTHAVFRDKLLATGVAPAAAASPLFAEPKPLHLAAMSGGINQDMVAGMEYPPTLADRVADACAVVAMVREGRQPNGALVDQPTWYNSLGVIGRCIDGRDVVHEWSAKDPRYTFGETQGAYDRAMGFGPATCLKLGEQHPDACAVCPSRSRVKSPIMLGVDPAPATPIQVLTTAPNAPPPGAVDIFGQPVAQGGVPNVAIGMPSGFSWMTPTGGKRSQLCKLHPTGEEDDQGQPAFDWQPFCNTLFYPVGRLGDDIAGYTNEMEMVVRDGQKRRFLVETSLIAEGGRSLNGRLGKFEIAALPRMENMMADYLRRWMEDLTQTHDAMQARQHFGWQEDTHDFLVGSTLYTPAGAETAVLKGGAAQRSRVLQPTGSYDIWKQVIDRAYNHPGQEALQFCVLLGFASPLLHLLKQQEGITVYAHSEGTGKGKSTAQWAALSAWGDYDRMELKDGKTTANMLFALAGMYHNIPVMYDELTNTTNAATSDLVFSVSSGRGKERMASDGSFRDNNSNWCTILMASGNNLLSEKLASHRANAEAEVARLFEFTVSCAPVIDVNEAARLFPLLRENYGHAGPAFIQAVAKNYDKVVAYMQKVQQAFNQEAQITQGERYWSALATCVLTAATLCRQYGILGFDTVGIKNWLLQQIAYNRGSKAAAASDPLQMFGEVLSELWQGVLITQGEGDLRQNAEARVIGHGPRGALTGRAIIPVLDPNTGMPREKSLVFISAAAIRGWCNKRGVSAKELKSAAEAAGWVQRAEARYTLGKGTTQYSGVSSPINCWVVDWQKMGSSSVGGEFTAVVNSLKSGSGNAGISSGASR
jgi:hypothetical protein